MKNIDTTKRAASVKIGNGTKVIERLYAIRENGIHYATLMLDSQGAQKLLRRIGEDALIAYVDVTGAEGDVWTCTDDELRGKMWKAGRDALINAGIIKMEESAAGTMEPFFTND